MDVYHSSEMQTKANELSNIVIGAAIEVHRELGPGLLESAYEACLCRELTLRHVAFERQVPLPVVYKAWKSTAPTGWTSWWKTSWPWNLRPSGSSNPFTKPSY